MGTGTTSRWRARLIAVVACSLLAGSPWAAPSPAAALTPHDPVPKVDVVPLFLWTDAQDSYAAADFGGQLNAHLAKTGQRLSTRECSPGHLPNIEQTATFEDPAFLRDPAAVKVAHPHTVAAVKERKHATCSAPLRRAAARSYVLAESLRLEWLDVAAELEHEEPIATARLQYADCVAAHGYQRTTYVTDPKFTAPPERADQVRMDESACLAPIIATVTQTRIAARDAFVQEHASTVQQLRAAVRALPLDRVLRAGIVAERPAASGRRQQ